MIFSKFLRWSALVLIIFFSTSLIAQTPEVNDGFSFKLKKVVRNSKKHEVTSSPYRIGIPENAKKIQFRFRVKSLSKKREDFDPNKLSLVSEKYKVRFRPIDVKHNEFMTAYFGIGYLVDHDLGDESKFFYLSYKPDIKDTFEDYSRDGYKNLQANINFGTKTKPDLQTIYYEHKKLRSNLVDFYFSVPKELTKGSIFYGNQKLFTIDEID